MGILNLFGWGALGLAALWEGAAETVGVRQAIEQAKAEGRPTGLYGTGEWDVRTGKRVISMRDMDNDFVLLDYKNPIVVRNITEEERIAKIPEDIKKREEQGYTSYKWLQKEVGFLRQGKWVLREISSNRVFELSHKIEDNRLRFFKTYIGEVEPVEIDAIEFCQLGGFVETLDFMRLPRDLRVEYVFITWRVLFQQFLKSHEHGSLGSGLDATHFAAKIRREKFYEWNWDYAYREVGTHQPYSLTKKVEDGKTYYFRNLLEWNHKKREPLVVKIFLINKEEYLSWGGKE